MHVVLFPGNHSISRSNVSMCQHKRGACTLYERTLQRQTAVSPLISYDHWYNTGRPTTM